MTDPFMDIFMEHPELRNDEILQGINGQYKAISTRYCQMLEKNADGDEGADIWLRDHAGEYNEVLYNLVQQFGERVKKLIAI